MNKIYAVIPARGGSKRIPNKNIQAINGKPLIAYPVEAARISGVFEDIIVSTDSQTIAEAARKYGANIPFMRENSLADDFTPTIPVIRDSILRVAGIDESDLVCCLYPTSVFITPELLKHAAKVSQTLKHDNFLVSFTKYPYPIQRALQKNNEGELSFVHPENADARSQDLEPAFHDAAQFYIARKSAWFSQDSVFRQAIGIEIPSNLVQDIDTPDDLERARLILSLRDSKLFRGI